jgi:HK97 family phage portal protein
VADLMWWPAKGPPKFMQREKALTGTPDVLESLSERTALPFRLLGGGSRQRIQDAYNTAHSASYAWMYRSSPAVRTVIDTITRNIGQLDLRLYEELSEAEREPRPEHDAALSLRYPNEADSQDRWIRQMFKQFLINDDAYSLMTPAAGAQFSVFSVPTHMVEVSGESLWRADSYIITKRDGTRDRWPTENIMHWRGENPDDPRIGLSALESIRSVIAEDAALQVAITELANAGLTEPVYAWRPLEAPLIPDPQTVARLEEDATNKVNQRHRRVSLWQEGTELRSFGVSPRDAQMFEVRKWAIERVASVFGVPLGMVGLDDNLDEARTQFYADTLPPYCESFTKMLNHRVLVSVYNWTDGCFEFNLDEKHMGDDRLKALVSATGRPVMLTNEARAKVNLPPVDGGDELVTPSNVVVGEKPSVDVMPIQNPNGPAQDGSARDGDLPEVSRRAIGVKSEEYEPITPLLPAWKRDLDAQHRAIDACQGVVDRHLGRVERALRGKAALTQKATDRDWQRWDKEFGGDLNTVLAAIAAQEGTSYALKLSGGDFDRSQVENWLKAMAEESAIAINATIRSEVRELGLENAMSKRAQHVESAGASLGAGVTRFAREEAAKQSPGYESRVKTWIPNTTRHASHAGETVPIGANWPAGFAPGSAPGCRCTMSID